MAEAIINVDFSSFSIGLILSLTRVSVTDLSKEWVEAMTTCKVASSTGRTPDLVKASSRSKALFLSDSCLVFSSVSEVGCDNNAFWKDFDQLEPTFIIVG